MGRYRKTDHFVNRLDENGVREGSRSKGAEPDPASLTPARVLANYGIQCLLRSPDGNERRLPIPRRLSAVAGDIALCDDERVWSLDQRRHVLARADHRRSQILAANIDRIVLVQSASDPPYREGLTDRYEVFCAVMGIPLVVVINKIDEASPGIRELTRRHEDLGVRVIETSVKTGEGMDVVAEVLARGVGVLSGHSGVGKSSILRRLLPGQDIEVGELHATRKRGRQTTTTARAYAYRDGFVIDTPGVRQFSLVGIEPSEVSRAFPDIGEVALNCRYRDCLHVTEPDCAVRRAVESGDLHADRYDSYRRIVESLSV